jgi:hypothetical protein
LYVFSVSEKEYWRPGVVVDFVLELQILAKWWEESPEGGCGWPWLRFVTALELARDLLIL